ncbi:MAG: DMT family transporter [Blastocatellia bacterium]|nr:DMT family transporter [Blastocatellia bacterium]
MSNPSLTQSRAILTEKSRHHLLSPDLTMSFVILVWGANFAVVKAAMNELPPLPFSAIRFGLATVALMALLRWREGDCKFPPGTLKKFLWLGIVGNTIYQCLFCLGLYYTTSANASLILTTTPVTVAIAAGLLGLEKITRNLMIGLALAFGGIVIVVAMRGAALSSSTMWGDLMMLGAVFCWAAYVLGLRTVAVGISSLRVTTLTLMTGAPGLLLLGLPGLAQIDGRRIGLAAVFGILFSSVVALVICYMLYNRNVRLLGSVRVSIYGCVIPIVAAIVAWPVLGERPTWIQAGGAALVIGGVLITRRR